MRKIYRLLEIVSGVKCEPNFIILKAIIIKHYSPWYFLSVVCLLKAFNITGKLLLVFNLFENPKVI